MMLVFPRHLAALGIASWGFSHLNSIGGRMFRFFGVVENFVHCLQV